MNIILIILFTWITIGLIINLFSSEKIPYSKDYTEQDKKDLRFDLFMGPISIIMFIIFLNNKD